MYIYAHTLVNVRHFMEKYIVSCGLYTTVPTVRHFALLYLMYLTAPYCTLLYLAAHLTAPYSPQCCTCPVPSVAILAHAVQALIPFLV